jgi:hypothetical protein
MTRTLEWQFGGWMRQWPAPVAWGALGVLAVIGSLLIVWLYRRTLRTLPPPARVALTILRVAIALVLLLCLANPARVERGGPDASARDTLAVVVDRSDSMNAADHRGATRLASAVRLWKQHENEAREAFPKTSYRQFAVGSSAVPSLDTAAETRAPAGPETHLYAALRQTLDAAPGAVVCLTDGLDTTAEKADALAADAQRRGVPLYFVLGANRARAGESLNIREIQSPSQVLRQTQFTASALLEAASPQDRELPVELWSGDQKLASARLPLRAGSNTLPWSAQVTAAEPGPMLLEFRVGEGPARQIAACTTQVVEHTKVEVLYYQGALQWGYRFLLAALQSDPSFHMTGILNPALGVQITASSLNQATLPDLPDDARALKKFQIIVLAHVFADRLSDKQQRALVDYARGGGGVLFIAPDTEATQRFAGTALERMLPVAFEPAGTERSEDELARRFREQMAVSDSEGDDSMLTANSRRQTLPRLQPFALPPGGNRSTLAAIFQSRDPAGLPKFCDYAKVRAIKPGADVLAVKQPARGENEPRVLLARQPFGAGFSAALTTDLLWRWKMSLPSTSRAAEKFWQQLLLSLAPPPGAGLRLVKLTEAPSINAPVALRVEGSTVTANSAPAVEAVSPTGERQPLALRSLGNGADGKEGAAWQVSFTPAATGRWEVRASDPAKNQARLTFPVLAKAPTVESLDLPPDIEGMRRLAESTGGALIENEPIFQARKALDPSLGDNAQPRRVRPLWNSAWLLGLMLGLYGTELIVRRCYRLL